MEIQHILIFLISCCLSCPSTLKAWQTRDDISNYGKINKFFATIFNFWHHKQVGEGMDNKIHKSCAIQCMPSMCGENISLILVVTPICLCPLLCPNHGYVNTCGSHDLEFWNPNTKTYKKFNMKSLISWWTNNHIIFVYTFFNTSLSKSKVLQNWIYHSITICYKEK